MVWNGWEVVMDKQTVVSRLSECAPEIRRRFSVEALFVFGSVARGEAAEGSDVDVLVTFKEKATFDLFMDLKFYLEEVVGGAVDLVTEKAIRPQMRRVIDQEMINVA